jgi:hypothetical protein
VYNKVERLLPAEKHVLQASDRALAISALDRTTVLPVLAAIEQALWRDGHDVRA